jgi:hypothetical protein
MDAKLKHLEFLQGVISRMATNSFLFKGWAITIAAGISAFAAADTKAGALVIALASTLMFWALDGYYLWLERCFIALYTKVAAAKDDAIDFSMTIDKSHGARKWFKTCFRPHLVLFYGSILVIEVVGILVIRSK